MEKTVLFACILSVIEAITKESSWKNLQTVLATGHIATPPWFATGNATEVGVSMYLTQMRNLGRVELEVTFYLRQTWEDKRLSFPQSQPNDYVALGPTDRSKIWVPDTFIPNELQSTLHSMTAQNDEIRVYFNGTVTRKMRVTVLFICELQLQRFPHDSQTCWMKLSSFSHRSDEMILTWSETDPIKFSPDYVSVHLVMMAYYAETCESVLDGEAHSCLRFLMKLDRQHHGYVLRVYLPSFFIVTMSWVGLWIDKEQVSARTSLGTLCIVSILTQILSLIILLPDAIELKAIDIWLGACMVFVTISFIIFAVVHYMKRQQKRRKAQMEKNKKATENGEEVKEPRKSICRYTSGKVEEIARYLYLLAFIAFNIAYWAYFLT